MSQLANMEHSFHHILLLEIKSITDTFSSILGPQSRDIFRMSNSFTAIAKLLTRQLETAMARSDRWAGIPGYLGDLLWTHRGKAQKDVLSFVGIKVSKESQTHYLNIE